jgi:hypothetical protein
MKVAEDFHHRAGSAAEILVASHRPRLTPRGVG